MLRVLALLSFVIISAAKVLDAPDNLLDYGIDAQDFRIVQDPLWVLKIHQDWDLKLKPASPDDEDEFEENAGPIIDNYERTVALKRVSPKPRVKKTNEMVFVEKEAILKLLNKFAMHGNVEPDAYLTAGNDDDISLTLYFKSPYTFLEVNVGKMQWHYFIKPPMALPEWFYEEHVLSPGESSMMVPEEVKQPFYDALMRMLLAMLKFPL